MKKPLIPMIILMFVALFFAGQGIVMHSQVKTEEAKFHTLQREYFTLAKAEREGATTGSELNQKLVEIQNYPSTLLELKLVGVGKILTGIFVLLLGILVALIMMPKRLAGVIKDNSITV
ncbi:hypothetical protein GW766_02345 [Candidatus Parcubacteria bacterium]|nr:hypothetical protein [Candidatus Parcubacteria bacterium]